MTKEKNYVVRKFGPTTKRRDYSKTANNLEVKNLLSIQRKSFQWFLDEGIISTFKKIYPIVSNNERIKLEFLPKTLRIQKPENEFEEIKKAKRKGTTYNFKVYGQVRKIDNDTAEVKDQEVLFGDIPLMTSGGTFIINGSEKVIVSQLLRSPGAYYGVNVRTTKSSDGELYNQLEIIPSLGLWLDLYHRVTGSSTDYVKISIDKNKTISLSIFLRSLGMPKDVILETFGDTPVLRETLRRDKKLTEDECLDHVYGVIHRGDRVTNESKRNLYANLFFNRRRYNLSKTGRYTLNRKLNLVERLTNTVLAEDLKTSTGKVLHKKGTLVDFEKAKAIQADFDDKILALQEVKGISSEVYANELKSSPGLKNKNKVVIVHVHKDIDDYNEQKEPIKVIANDPSSESTILLISDIVAAISYYFNLTMGLGIDDDPDSLFNKRVVNIGELLQNQFQIGLTRMERNAKELMSSKEPEKITPKNVTNNKAIFNQFKTFFNSSQLSQFMDQMNPLAEIANKRRLTSLGPGGLNRETANFEVRDVHPTHYGRICPIETPEGPNIGLILNFANYSRVNDLGFIETPYYPVKNGIVDPKPVYLSAFDEKGSTFAQSGTQLDENNKIIQSKITVRKDFDYIVVGPKEVDYLDVSSKQITSIAASCIPFLENDDANRSLMGSNMQRQAVPLINAEAPLVGTGVEADIAKYSAANLRVSKDCEVTYVDSEMIKVVFKNKKSRTYYLRVFERSNQGSVICQKPIVKVGQKLKAGDILTDGPSFDKGELALGRNVLAAFTTWNGFNYEDAIILSENLVKDDVYTSIHIEEEIIHFRKAKAGDDELTNKVPNVSNYALRNLDENGVVRVGSEVFAGDVLVGRVSSKGEDNPTPEEKLIAAIFAKKTKNQKDTSLKVKNGRGGTIIDVQILSRENGDDLQDGIKMTVKVLIAEKRKIKPGDKMAGRHGNKGVISRILPVEDMPHLEDGTPIDIMLNPQGVPSRMNIGQVLELHLGMAALKLKEKFVSPVFDGINYKTINEILNESSLPQDGKFTLYDPISGKKFAQKVSVGAMYMLKLAHMVDDKMHSRSVGPYSLITQQPLGGKSQNGGQRFGEMETWAIEAFGATNVLQELLTYKSDNIDGRNMVYNAVANGSPLPNAGTPESFNVLAYELRGLGMKLAIELKEKK